LLIFVTSPDFKCSFKFSSRTGGDALVVVTTRVWAYSYIRLRSGRLPYTGSVRSHPANHTSTAGSEGRQVTHARDKTRDNNAPCTHRTVFPHLKPYSPSSTSPTSIAVLRKSGRSSPPAQWPRAMHPTALTMYPYEVISCVRPALGRAPSP
jgi:hypothetical protein